MEIPVAPMPASDTKLALSKLAEDGISANTSTVTEVCAGTVRDEENATDNAETEAYGTPYDTPFTETLKFCNCPIAPERTSVREESEMS